MGDQTCQRFEATAVGFETGFSRLRVRPSNRYAIAPHIIGGDFYLFLNISKTKYIHINPSANYSVQSSDGSQIEKVEDFKYLGSYTNSRHDIQCRKAQAWAAVHALDKVWRAPICRLAKLKIFRTTVEPILIYGCDSWSLTQSVKMHWMAPTQDCCRKLKMCHGATT